MNANKYVLRPATSGPCNASPVHISFGRGGLEPAEYRRPEPGRVLSPRRAKCRCSVRSRRPPRAAAQDPPHLAAVRAGFSRLSAAATSSTAAGVRGADCRAQGTRASNPPARQVSDPPVQRDR